MIFTTCGSSPLPFYRMMEALRVLPATDLYVQHGPVAPPPCANSAPFVTFGEMLELIERADIVVSHAGVGSIMCALRAGHTPIVFPRLKRYTETTDDHQAELATALAGRGTVIVAWTPEELLQAVESAPPRRAAQVLDAGPLSQAVRAAVLEEQASRRRIGRLPRDPRTNAGGAGNGVGPDFEAHPVSRTRRP